MIRPFGLLLFTLLIHFANAQVKLSNEVSDIKMVYNQDSSMINSLHWNIGNKAVEYTLPKPLSLFSLSEKNNKYGKSYLQNRITKTITTKIWT